MNLKKQAIDQLLVLKENLHPKEIVAGIQLYNDEKCTLLSQSGMKFDFVVEDGSDEGLDCAIRFIEGSTYFSVNGDGAEWDANGYACLLALKAELDSLNPKTHEEHKKYTREGMRQRVLSERRLKADKADYKIKWADNIYGDHILTNEKGIEYRVFLRDFENETGYSNSEDAKLNKLGTTKHIMYVFDKMKSNEALYKRLSKTYPFIEIYCDPLNDNNITCYFPGDLSVEESALIEKYFGHKTYIEEQDLAGFLDFIDESKELERIHIRPEVHGKIEALYDLSLLKMLSASYQPDYSAIKAALFPYQKKGVEFVLFRKSAIIADEMGLGKTLQAISAAVLKKNIFGFKKALIVCPASIKAQWKSEIERFTEEQAVIVEGIPEEREKVYLRDNAYFYIVNYETILRDSQAINRAGIDFLILDEAQRVKNFETKTASAVKRLNARHTLVITGTPIENKLIDIFSIMAILDPHFFGPLWEFSYQHCLFDPERKDKINGYYNLQSLNKKLENIVLRRQKRQVLEELPNLQQIDIPMKMSPLQSEMHASFVSGLGQIVRKKYLTPYDLKKLQLLLANMRMVCDSTYLIDDQTNESPKLEELQYILLENLDIRNNDIKLIIFSEWVKVHKLIGDMLREHNVGFVELNGKVPVKNRGALIKKFESDPNIKIFLSTEAGGSGLNLQVADTLINFELPWNPAKKNQRIGRIDRLGQKSKKLVIYNFITKGSIEEQIATGLIVKQNLFEGVLDQASVTDFVDFSRKGRSQFIEQLEQMIDTLEKQPVVEEKPEVELSIEEVTPTEVKDQLELDFSEEGQEEQEATSPPAPVVQPTESQQEKVHEIEQVMNNGMQFLAGLFKMSTGKDMGIEGQKIEVNRETGEVTMKFKLPGF